jgi:hypothetical protein
MDYQHYIADALDMVSAWEIPEEDFAQVVNDQVKILAMADNEISEFDDFASQYNIPLQF